MFSAQSLLLSNLAVLEDKHFQGLSVTSERWLPLGEVRSWGEGRGGEGGEKEKGRIGGGGKRDKGINGFILHIQVKLNALREYLLSMRRSGYAIVGLEQTMRSKCASSYKFQRETVLVLG